MSLYIRMALYALFAGAAGFGLGTFDGEAGTLTLEIDTLAAILAPMVGFVGTFIWSRIAKRKGGAT